MFSTVTLALDGIITDTTHMHYESFLYAFNFFNIFLPDNLSYEEQIIFRKNNLLHSLLSLNTDQKEDIIKKKNDYYSTYLTKLNFEDLYPGIDNLFSEMEHLSIKINCYSDNPLAKNVLKQLGLNYETNILTLDDLSNQSSDIMIVDHKTELNHNPSLLLFLTQDYSNNKRVHCIQNTEEITMAYLKKIWEEQR